MLIWSVSSQFTIKVNKVMDLIYCIASRFQFSWQFFIVAAAPYFQLSMSLVNMGVASQLLCNEATVLLVPPPLLLYSLAQFSTFMRA